jgi:hypothetical protein
MSPPKSRVRPHLFQPNPDLGVDHQGRHTCICGLTGVPGDAHHTLPDRPVADAQQRAAGETEGD